MTSIGRNDSCPCNSGKKYKHCYLNNDESCSLLQKERGEKEGHEHEARIQKSMSVLLSMTSELENLFHQTDAGIEVVPTRMQLIGIFTILDVLGHYYNEYSGKSLKPTERFVNYANRFCFVSENKEYAERKYLGNMSVEELMTLRNGLVHFYGLAEAKYCILPNVTKIRTAKAINKAHENFIKFSAVMGRNLLFIQPFELKRIVIESAVLLIGHYKTLESESQDSKEKRLAHITGMKRIFDKLQKEGASTVDKKMADLLEKTLASS